MLNARQWCTVLESGMMADDLIAPPGRGVMDSGLMCLLHHVLRRECAVGILSTA